MLTFWRGKELSILANVLFPYVSFMFPIVLPDHLLVWRMHMYGIEWELMGTGKATATWAPKMNWSQLLLRHCEDIREGKKVSNIELIYQSVHSAWISLVGCHRPCKPVGWVGSWCLEWKIEVLRVLKSYMWTPSIAAGCDSPVAHDEARVEDCNFAFFHAFLLMCEAELGDSPLCGFCCLSGPSCWEPHGAF